jgi:hypothetical protein
MRLTVTPEFQINAFSGATITELESGVTNGIIDTQNGQTYLTQRPAIDVFSDASDTVADARGRGIYYWDGNSALYFINDDTIYKTSYSTTIGAITAGTKRCYFFTLASRLIVLDPENNKGWTVTTGGTLAEITDTDFPPKQTPAVGIAFGGAILDGFLFVLGEDGTIYNSDLEDATSWNALNYIAAERSQDGGVYLGKHHDHIFVMGPNTIEFFYNAANPTGSPLARRQDVSYNIGCASGEAVLEDGDRVFFVGANTNGALGVYTMEKFNISKISTSSIDSFLTQAIVKDGYSVIGSGFSGKGHSFYLMTFYTTPADVAPETTLAFDATTGQWSLWDATVNGLSDFPLINWTVRTGSRYGEGILSNGDMITINDDLSPYDTLLAAVYVVTGYVDTGYITETSGSGTPIVMKTRIGQFDAGTDSKKFMQRLRHVAEETAEPQTLTVRWSDENNDSFNTGLTLDTSKFNRLHRLGKFRRRNFEVEYGGSETLKLFALEASLLSGGV